MLGRAFQGKSNKKDRETDADRTDSPQMMSQASIHEKLMDGLKDRMSQEESVSKLRKLIKVKV